MPTSPQKLTSSHCSPLAGELTPPGDKSISHRSVMLGALATGETTISGLLESEDVFCTIKAMRAMGADIRKDSDNIWHINGVGASGLKAPQEDLYMGNSGTSARLLMGIVAGQNFSARFTGDASLSNRPMARVIEPLSQMGARFDSPQSSLPLTVKGSAHPRPIIYMLPVASAQVKSAILFAGLGAEGTTTIIQTTPTRDHTENLLRSFGAEVLAEMRADGAEIISFAGKQILKEQNINVPGDISSAAFPLVAAVLCPDSEVKLRRVGVNSRRAGLIDVLRSMGASIVMENKRDEGAEPVADLIVHAGKLTGVTVPPSLAPNMIDEYPILSIAAACAKGTTRMKGLGELRVKESDRLNAMMQGLVQCGVKVDVDGDDLIIYGTGHPPEGGATIATGMDHRIAMSFLILGMTTARPISIDDGSFIGTSFPAFAEMMNGLGANILYE